MKRKRSSSIVLKQNFNGVSHLPIYDRSKESLPRFFWDGFGKSFISVPNVNRLHILFADTIGSIEKILSFCAAVWKMKQKQNKNKKKNKKKKNKNKKQKKRERERETSAYQKENVINGIWYLLNNTVALKRFWVIRTSFCRYDQVHWEGTWLLCWHVDWKTKQKEEH